MVGLGSDAESRKSEGEGMVIASAMGGGDARGEEAQIGEVGARTGARSGGDAGSEDWRER